MSFHSDLNLNPRLDFFKSGPCYNYPFPTSGYLISIHGADYVSFSNSLSPELDPAQPVSAQQVCPGAERGDGQVELVDDQPRGEVGGEVLEETSEQPTAGR